MHTTSSTPSFLSSLKSDLPASIVVFFVALPLCLGIALASGAPLFSGVIAGIIGGIIVGLFSGSQLGVSGPAAGLAVIVLTSIGTLGSFPAFLMSVVVAGALQYLLGLFKVGFIAHFVPSSVIKGMLSGIGILIILKQIPFLFGYTSPSISPKSSLEINDVLSNSSLTATVIALVSFAILIAWDAVLTKKARVFQVLQGPIVVVSLGILVSYFISKGAIPGTLSPTHLVSLPVANSLSEFASFFTFPDFSSWNNIDVIKAGAVIAIVASLETLLCVEATDKLDPLKRVTPVNQELKAQGLGNLVSGLIGGLPITQVIVRSSANITFGAQSKLSAILHGFWLLLSALLIAGALNYIPLASLAAILVLVGYKLAKPELFRNMYKLGASQFIPFICTIVAIVATDLLTGIGVGLVTGILFALFQNYKLALTSKEIVTFDDGREVHTFVLAEDVSFLNKAGVKEALEGVPSGSKVILDCRNTVTMDYDVSETIEDFMKHASLKQISVEALNFNPSKP